MRRGVVVLGGNGYLGSSICRTAVRSAGLRCSSIARSGPPPNYRRGMKDVQWLRGDAARLSEHRDVLAQASAVISCVGAFGSNQHMERVCGDANIAAIKSAKEAGVPRFVYISVHPFPGLGLLLPGYLSGKRKAEAALAEIYGTSGVAIRPSMIYGTRRVKMLPVPLTVVGAPLAIAFGALPQLRGLPLIGELFAPPVSLHSVATSALMAALDESLSGVLSVDDIIRLTRI